MIFVTVGTHEQQFNRLIKCIDKWAGKHDEAVVVQTGYSTYEPKNCQWQKSFSYKLMTQNIQNARIVITHGGPSSFIAPLQIGKVPIVVPRKKEFGEHVNNHQVIFCKKMAERMGAILLVENIFELPDIIDKYDNYASTLKKNINNNNARFCAEFEKIVDGMF